MKIVGNDVLRASIYIFFITNVREEGGKGGIMKETSSEICSSENCGE